MLCLEGVKVQESRVSYKATFWYPVLEDLLINDLYVREQQLCKEWERKGLPKVVRAVASNAIVPFTLLCS